MRILKLIVTLVLLLAIVGFLLANRQIVTLTFFPIKEVVELPMFIVILAALVVGVIVSELIHIYQTARRRIVWNRNEIEKQALKQEIESLKASRELQQLLHSNDYS